MGAASPLKSARRNSTRIIRQRIHSFVLMLPRRQLRRYMCKLQGLFIWGFSQGNLNTSSYCPESGTKTIGRLPADSPNTSELGCCKSGSLSCRRRTSTNTSTSALAPFWSPVLALVLSPQSPDLSIGGGPCNRRSCICDHVELHLSRLVHTHLLPKENRTYRSVFDSWNARFEGMQAMPPHLRCRNQGQRCESLGDQRNHSPQQATGTRPQISC